MKLNVKYLALVLLALIGLAPSEVWGSAKNYYANLTIAKSTAAGTGNGTVWCGTERTESDKTRTTAELSSTTSGDDKVYFWVFAEPEADSSYYIGFADNPNTTAPNISVEDSSTANAYKFRCKVSTSEDGHEYYKIYAIFGAKYACTLTQPASGGTLVWGSSTSPSPASSGIVYQMPSTESTLEVVAKPNTGYKVDKWYVNGTATDDTGNTLTRTVTGTTIISVTFKTYYQVRAQLTAEPSEGGGIYISQGDWKGKPPQLFYGITDYSDPEKETSMSIPFWCYASASAGYMHAGWQTPEQKGTATLDSEATSYAPGVTNECKIIRDTPSTPGKATYDYYAVFAKEASTVLKPEIGGTTARLDNISYWKITDTSVASGSLSGTTLRVSGLKSGTTQVIVYQGGEWKYYTITPTVKYWAKMTTVVLGGGRAYASSNPSEQITAYSAETLTATSSLASATAPANVSFYLFALPDLGYKFTGWSKGSAEAAITITDPKPAAAQTVSTSATSAGAAPNENYYAHFSNAGVTVKDVYLAVGDQVQFFFYNSTAGAFSTCVNSNVTTVATAVSGDYATFKRSAGNVKVNKFNVTITATAASSSGCDKLTVMDYQGNVYHYRVHVSAQRVVKKKRTDITTPAVTATATSHHSDVWWLDYDSVSTYVTAKVTPIEASDTGTVAFTGKAASSGVVTVKASNYYEDELTTGEQGAIYTYALTVIDPPVYTYYAQVATVVVDGSSTGAGRGWAYASRNRQEDSDVYQTTRCPSELGKVTYYENVASTNVNGFYIFAFPNMGYKFKGWSVNDPNGKIVSTEAFSASGASITVQASSQDGDNPTVDTYYAHFEKDDSKVKDITLAVGDTVRLYFNNTTKCNWSLQVVYTNGTEKVVNLDDTAAHAGGYATYTRSASVEPASASNAFNMFVQATKASGNDFDQLTIEDYAGNVYHYRVHVVDRRVIECRDTAVFTASSFASKVWTHSGVTGSELTVSEQPNGVATDSVKLNVTGASKCQDSRFTVSNYSAESITGELGATYNFGMNVVDPWPVEFCQGDEVIIYYHNSVAKNWYLLINGQRIEPNVAGKGEQMTVTLLADNPDTDTEIRGVATTPGSGNGDLVIVTDGENFYPYRMAVRPRRVIEVGGSTSMTCSTVATSPWRYQLPSASAFYISTDFSPDENEGHSATVTITGKNPGKNNIVYVANFKHDQAEINAQGAMYTLVTDVVGPHTRSVYMSQGTSVTWGEYYDEATAESTYTVTPAEENLMTAAIASKTADTVFTTLTTPANAVPYKKALFTVKDQNNKDVVKYDVMSYTIMSMAVGQVAPGCLTGSPTPWVVVSSDPAKLSAEPTVYNKLNSGRIEAKAPGDVSIWATNGYDQVGWYSIRAQVYDEAEQLVAIPVNGTTNIVISSAAGLESVWTLTKSDENITATLDNTSTPADHVTVTIVGGTDEGTHQVQVNNAFHHEKLKVFVGADPGQQVVLAGSITFTAYNTVSMPGAAPTVDWTAKTSAEASGKFTLVNESGAAGEPVQVYGIAPGKGQVIVDAGSTIYVYDVEVAKNDSSLPALTVGVGYTLTTNLTAISSDLAGATLYQAPDSMIANAMVSGNNLILSGVQEGRSTLKLATDSYIYTMEVIVHERNIVKYITLYTGDKDTTTSYSYTFDKVVSVVNGATDRLNVTQVGEKITISAKSGVEGIGGVTVEGFVDGLAESSFINYHVTIIKQSAGYKVQQYDEGHIAYRDADVMREQDGDLIFVFTNVNSVGSLIIPDGYSARVDILAIGGGGGGGSATTGRAGGGGGAGGYTSVTNKKLTAGTFGVQIGPGGLGLGTSIGSEVALPGSNGGASLVTNSFGYVIAAGNGGGGGGAPTVLYYSGIEGGSGGGGSWVWDTLSASWVAGRGGLGTDGQGCSGGTPAQVDCGGSGGGASSNGGSDQTRGEGKYSDISGVNTYYSLGGEGGRGDSAKVAADGQGPGFGGDGGNGGPGGDGGDGTVVIRFHRLYQNILVPIPTTNDLITARFQWEDGTNYTPIVYQGLSFRSPSNSHPYNWEDVFETITGTTNVVCELGGDGGTNKVGVGYYNFYLKLKDGYAWDDGSEYGSVEKLGYRWVICENWSDIDADINVHKTVTWSDKSNAVIRVSSLASPEMTGGGTPKVLFLGTLCNAHELEASTIVASLNSITKQADVDYYLYGNSALRKQGSLKIGETITQSELGVSLTYSQHSALRAFYEQLYQSLVVDENTNKYDYIVMEFDGSRIAKYYVDNNDNKSSATIYQKFAYEQQVAQALVPFYAKEAVIWIVDNGDEEKGNNSYPLDEPFGHTASYSSSRGTTDLNVYWIPNTYFYSAGHLKLTDTQYQGLVGIFDPKNYIAGDSVTAEELSTTNTTYGPRTSSTQRIAESVYYGNDRNDLQAHYANPELVTNLLSNAIKVKPFNLYYQDKIVSPEEGLTIQDVYVTVCTTFDDDGDPSEVESDWKALMHWVASTGQVVYDDPYHLTGVPGSSMSVNTESNLVEVCLSNINFKVWVRYDTHVLDAEGKFQTSDGANYNEQTGQYEKNPNEGAAQVSLVDDLGVGIGVEGDAETEVPWRYTAYTVSGTAKNGSVYVAGTQYSSLSCPEGRDVTVYYRGNGGFRLTALMVDGNSVEVGTGYDNAYTFKDLDSEHTVQATYTAYYGTVTNIPTTFQYDGIAHVPEVQLDGWDAAYATEVRYSLTEEGPYYTQAEFEEMYSTNRDVACVGEHTVYTRVYAFQEGYGQSVDEKGWVWVDTRVVEKGTVTITPKPLTIIANSFYLSGTEAPKTPPLDQWRGVHVNGLVEGDTVNTNENYLTFDCPTYQYDIGQYAVYPVYEEGITAEDVAGTNYVVYLRPGVLSVIKSAMIIGGVPQFDGLDPEAVDAETGVDRVEIEYNGMPTNLVITVDDPIGSKAENLIYKYSIDDGETWTSELPTRLHVGTNKVWYVIEDGTDFEKALYFPVTNYNYLIINPRAITFTAASATKRYDGTALSTNDYEITEGSLATGDSLVSISVTGSRTDVGTTPNVVSGARIENSAHGEENLDRTSDYEITYIDGEIAITPGGITVGDHPYEPGQQTAYGYAFSGVRDVEKDYDGIGTNIEVNVVVPESGYRVYYTTNQLNDANIVWHDELSLKDAGRYPVNFLIQADNYADVTNMAYVTIHPRKLKVEIKDTYMRKGAADPEYKVVIIDTVTGQTLPDEFVEELGLDIQIGPTNSLYHTECGEYDLVLLSDTLQGNFELEAVPGTLTVDEKEDVLCKVTDTVAQYDGTGYTVAVTVTNGVEDCTIKYSLSPDGPWYDTPPEMTNAVSATRIYYKVTPPAGTSYRETTGYAVLAINPKPVTVTAGSASKSYDGTPLTCSTYEANGFLEGQGVQSLSMTAASTITEIGTQLNVIDESTITAADGTLLSNYDITCVNGTLTITGAIIEIGGKPQDPTQPGGLPTPDKPGTTGDNDTGVPNVKKTYDGNPTNIVVEVTNPPEGGTITYLVGENPPGPGDTPTGDVPTFTDAGTNKVWYIVEAPNHIPVTNYAWVVIDPKSVTMTADDKTKEYGQPDPAFTVTTPGLVGDDTVTNAISRASGEEYGDYTITPTGDERQGNYVVTYATGTLTITNESVKSLWICDHEDAGANKVYLAFSLEKGIGTLTADFAKRLDADGRIKVAYAATKADLDDATPVVVHLRDATGQLDIDKGWIWVTVDYAPHLNSGKVFWKVVIGD